MELLQILLHFDRYLGSVITQSGSWIYLLLFGIVFCETALIPLFFLPGNPLLFICGAYCATGMLNVWIVLGILFIAALGGSLVNYALGRFIGKQVYTRNYRWLDRAALLKTHAFYESYGGTSFLFSLFIPVVRTFAPLIAGVSEMHATRFALFVATGAAIWVLILVPAGYFFGNLPLIHDNLNTLLLVGIALGVGAVIVSGLWRAYHKPRTPRLREK
jgi:membrane-associated protein